MQLQVYILQLEAFFAIGRVDDASHVSHGGKHGVQHSVSALPLKWHQKHTRTHIKNITTQAIVYKRIIYTASVENPRVGGSIPPLGTIFTNKNKYLILRDAR